MSASAVDDVRKLADAAAADAGLVVEDVTITGVGRRRLVKVIVDLPEDETGGVPMDAVAQASQTLSEQLDSSDALGAAPYVLEVTSPGISRPLTEPRHWKRARGRLVTVQLIPVEGAKAEPVTGRLIDVQDDGVVLSAAKTTEVALSWTQIARGVVQIEFSDPTEKSPKQSPAEPSATAPRGRGKAAERRPSSAEEN